MDTNKKPITLPTDVPAVERVYTVKGQPVRFTFLNRDRYFFNREGGIDKVVKMSYDEFTALMKKLGYNPGDQISFGD